MTDEQKQQALTRYRAQCEVAWLARGRITADEAVAMARSVYREFGLDWDEEVSASGQGADKGWAYATALKTTGHP